MLSKFVCVRVVEANDLDLALFQFDYNLAWSVMFLNPDRTVYGRYGSRDQKDGGARISIAGLKKAMAGALDLHRGYPANREALRGKSGPAPLHARPQGFPSLGGYALRLGGGKNLGQSCLHCHQLLEAEQRLARDGGRPIPDELLWYYPSPEWLGLDLDPEGAARVARVAPGSAAARAGFEAGDEIERLDGQPIISIADVQWVLHRVREPARLRAELRRGAESVAIELPLDQGWRRAGDFSWRFFVHEGFYTGNLRVAGLPEEERRALGLAAGLPALKVTRVGWGGGGPPAASKLAGFLIGDVIIEVDGRAAPASESAFVSWMAQSKLPGDVVRFVVRRGEKRLELAMTLAE